MIQDGFYNNNGDTIINIDTISTSPPDCQKPINLFRNKDYKVTDPGQPSNFTNETQQTNQHSGIAEQSTPNENGAPQQSPEENQKNLVQSKKEILNDAPIEILQPNGLDQQLQMVNSMKSEMSVNNLVSGLVRSRKARSEIEDQMNDDQQMNWLRQRLMTRDIEPLKDGLYVDEPFPVDALPEKASSLIKSVTQNLQVSQAAVGMALLGAIAIAARGNYKIEVKNGYLEALTAWFLVGLPSGERKSAIIGFFREIFDVIEGEQQIEFNRNFKKNNLKREALLKIKRSLQNQAIKDAVKDGINPERSIFLAEDLAEEFEPIEAALNSVNQKKTRFLIDSPTLKELAMAMSRQQETIGIFEPEGGIWKHRLRANDDILLKSYDMEPFGDETNTADSVVLTMPCLAVCSFMQSGVAAKLYNNETLKDHGLPQRISPAFPPPMAGLRHSDPIDVNEKDIKWYETKIRRLLSLPRPDGEPGERTLHIIKLNPKGLVLYKEFSREINNRILSGEFQEMQAFANKLPGHALRYTGLVHLIKHNDPHRHQIDASSMAAGIALARFFLVHAKAAFDPDRVKGQEYANKILKWADRHTRQRFTAQDANRGVGHCNINDIKKGLMVLEAHGYLGLYFTKTSIFCVVNPRYTFDTFKQK